MLTIELPGSITLGGALRHPVTAVEVHVEHLAELVGCLPGRGDGRPDARVVDQHVDAPEVLHRLVDERLAAVGIGDVGAHDDGALAGRLDELARVLELLDAAGAEGDVSAGLGEGLANATPRPDEAPVTMATFPSRLKRSRMGTRGSVPRRHSAHSPGSGNQRNRSNSSGSGGSAGASRRRRADDPPRLVELVRERALGRGRVRGAGVGVERDVVEAEQRPRATVRVLPQARGRVEAVERQQLPALVRDQVHRVDDVVEHRLAHEVVEADARERELRAEPARAGPARASPPTRPSSTG